jgi:hypothetical protein
MSKIKFSLFFVIFIFVAILVFSKTQYFKNKYIHENCGIAGCDGYVMRNYLKHENNNIADEMMSEILPATISENSNTKESFTQTEIKQTKPVILSLNKKSFKFGDKVEIRGENFYAFENDKVIILENTAGEKIYLGTDWNEWHSYISFTLQQEVCTVPEGESGLGCTERNGKMVSLKKGVYKMYYPDFSTNQNSNMVDFIIE